MNMTIWKYRLQITDLQSIKLPEGAEILSVHNQHGYLCLWVLVDLDKKVIDRYIEVFGTGHHVPEGPRKFIGTVLIDPFVWHVFERLN